MALSLQKGLHNSVLHSGCYTADAFKKKIVNTTITIN